MREMDWGLYMTQTLTLLRTFTTILVCLLFFTPHQTFAQDLNGNPLPDSVPQDVHDGVVEMEVEYDHWLACGYTIDFFQGIIDDLLLENDVLRLDLGTCLQDLETCENPPPPPGPVVPEGCTNVSDFVDGSGGALWKPVSDNTRNPVILYPSSLTGRLVRSSCVVYGVDGGRVVRCPYRTVANGGREHYDVPRRASSLVEDSPITVVIERDDGELDCRRVNDPTRRDD